MADKVYKNPLDQAFDWKQDFANRVSRNPTYKTMANYAAGEGSPINDDYFYAFKDAYERSKLYNKHQLMFKDEIEPFLSDRYWELQSQDQQWKGYNDNDYEYYGLPDFEKKYGTNEEFTKKGVDAWKRWMNENYGGDWEDYQTFGNVILRDRDKIKTLEDLDRYYQEWGGYDDSESEYAPNFYNNLRKFWINKLGFGGK